MEILNGTTEFKLHDTAVTIGKFDGIHRGHQLLLDTLRSFSAQGLTSVVLTFDMQPATLLRGSKIEPIYSREETEALLGKHGPDILVRYPFTKELASMTPDDFAEQILAEKLGAKAVVVGDDFRFGKDRSGDAECLRKLGDRLGFKTVVIDRLMIGGETVSSTAIRKLIEEGKTGEAEEMLGKEYFLE